MDLLLRRDSVLSVAQTYGVLTVSDLRLDTIERPWLPDPAHPGGQNGLSCVPPGAYDLVLHDSELHPQTWALVNPALGVWHWPTEVPASGGRAVVLIHPANYAHELLGCIAPGMGRGFANGVAMVTNSRVAFAQIKHAVPWAPGHTLTIEAAA